MYLIYVSDICIQHMMTVAGVKFLTPASPRCLLQGFAWKASQVSHLGKLTPSMLATRLCMTVAGVKFLTPASYVSDICIQHMW